MGRATRTIPSTHTGSLPRPDDLIQIMWAVGDGIPVDAKALDQRVCSAIDDATSERCWLSWYDGGSRLEC